MAQIGHRDATRLHEFVLDLVHDNEHPDGSWDDEFVVSLIDRLGVIADDLSGTDAYTTAFARLSR